jgi:hypothetical protein
LGNPYWSTECSRLHGIYTISTVTFWLGFALIAWYIGARLLAVVLAKPAKSDGLQ